MSSQRSLPAPLRSGSYAEARDRPGSVRRRFAIACVATGLWVLASLCFGSPLAAQSGVDARVAGYYEFYTGYRGEHATDFLTGRNRIRLDGRADHERGAAVASIRFTQSFVDPQAGGEFTSPVVRVWELFADAYAGRFDFRLGHQLIVWGQADGVFVTDLLSPLDLSEFIAQDFSDIRLAIPAAKAAFFGDDFGVTGVVTLLPVETILPTAESPWFVVPDLPPGIQTDLAESNLPGFGVENVEPAVRLEHFGIDRTSIGAIYMYGFNRIPTLGRALTSGEAGDPLLLITPGYYRRHVLGLRWSTAVAEPWVFDSETAFESRFDVPRRPGLDGAATDVVSTRRLQSMVAVERTFGSTLARVQFIADLVTPHDEVMFRDAFIPSTTAYLRRSFANESLIVSIFGFYNIGRDGWLNPALQWSPGGGSNIQFGAQLFLGSEVDLSGGPSAFSLYRDNDFVYVRLTQHF